jgi:hypothetical protein
MGSPSFLEIGDWLIIGLKCRILTELMANGQESKLHHRRIPDHRVLNQPQEIESALEFVDFPRLQT